MGQPHVGKLRHKEKGTYSRPQGSLVSGVLCPSSALPYVPMLEGQVGLPDCALCSPSLVHWHSPSCTQKKETFSQL